MRAPTQVVVSCIQDRKCEIHLLQLGLESLARSLQSIDFVLVWLRIVLELLLEDEIVRLNLGQLIIRLLQGRVDLCKFDCVLLRFNLD